MSPGLSLSRGVGLVATLLGGLLLVAWHKIVFS
jgi:hypothetical protein